LSINPVRGITLEVEGALCEAKGWTIVGNHITPVRQVLEYLPPGIRAGSKAVQKYEKWWILLPAPIGRKFVMNIDPVNVAEGRPLSRGLSLRERTRGLHGDKKRDNEKRQHT
jgi:hypothetical protein